MTPELPGQITSGTPLSERDCLREAVGCTRRLTEHVRAFATGQARMATPFRAQIELRGVRDAVRGLGLLRGDLRWFLAVRVLERLDDEMQREFRTVAKTEGYMAARTERWKRRVALLEKMEWQLGKMFDRACAPLLILPRAEWH